jgi:hypothetical protein
MLKQITKNHERSIGEKEENLQQYFEKRLIEWFQKPCICREERKHVKHECYR